MGGIRLVPAGLGARPALVLVHADSVVRRHGVGHLRDLLARTTQPDFAGPEVIAQTTHLAAVAIERNRTEAALLASEERFRRMADAIPEVIWFTALEPEKVLYVSPSFERIWGLPIKDLYQNPRRWIEAIHPDDRERVSRMFFKLGCRGAGKLSQR